MQSYPPTDRWGQLSEADQAARLDIASDMLELMTFWAEEGRLTEWEAGWCREVRRRLLVSGGRYKVSKKEWNVFRRIQGKIDFEDQAEADE